MVFLYNKEPIITICGWDEAVWQGYDSIVKELQRKMETKDKVVLTVECYPTVREHEIADGLRALDPNLVIFADEAAMEPERIQAKMQRYLTDDRVFGYMAPFTVDEFFIEGKVVQLRKRIQSVQKGLVLVIGFGASLLSSGDILVYTDLARWEIQLRYRSKEFGNWRANNQDEDILRKYKRGYFIEWRMADRLKRSLLHSIDYYLDTHIANEPKMTTKEALLDGLKQTVSRPFRLVPYFDPGVWGGYWLQEKIGLDPKQHPYAWGFDGVPEENSLYFQFSDIRMELPSINLVFFESVSLLGERVYARFGAEFPIRFDFLDTIGGQNLSLQVHPVTDYIHEAFGMRYTQDESYYILDAKPDATVFLGLKEGIHSEEMIEDLEKAQNGEISFPTEKYVNVFQAKKHDHFSIPAGTIHCSGRNAIVLEISATPYIFTFKLWDWDRVGLDGRPRPVHLRHGCLNVQWNRTTDWVKSHLISQVESTGEGDGWKEERTGLHEFEFIETRRHWFTALVQHHTNGSVNVLNLVEGEEAIVESPSGAFEPFVVHYAETFIVPASVGPYTIRPSERSGGKQLATIKAFVK
ncbi:MAG: mannose-6-phosphate isomerase [Bacilli bacterium]|nr:mannose-6-phosphate isomerase [Bacilli bacterium]